MDKKKQKKATLTISLDPELLDWIRQYTTEHLMNTSAWLCSLIERERKKDFKDTK